MDLDYDLLGLSLTENGTTFVETSSYNPSTNTLRVNVPPHNNYGQTDFLLDGNLVIYSIASLKISEC